MKQIVTFVAWFSDPKTGARYDRRTKRTFTEQIEMEQTIKKFHKKYKQQEHYLFSSDLEKIGKS